ncbi:hypothetical protein ABEG18_06395 [Alsobacter sp. KACC 23698]|uniref:Uncharacterized protein n=1 Tax=Alsobacter sp. KACC 23698 TaxID=3149229 RepID=A0AAU7JJ98_9HYPH
MPAGFRVADATGCMLAYCYGDSTGYRSTGSVMMSPDQAKAMAELIASLPDPMHGIGSATLPPGVQGPFEVEDRRTWFSVTDASGIRVAAVYFGDTEAGSLTRDAARRLAAGVSRLPDWVERPP